MKLINADKLKSDIRTRCFECALVGTKYCREQCAIYNICEIIDLQPLVAITDKPLAIINDKVIYMTNGHVNALLKYEHEQAVQEVCDRLMRELVEVQKWENDNGKK